MKVSIAFMLVALSYCLSSSSSFYIPQMETMMPEEDIYFYSRMTGHLMNRYQEAMECEEGPDRDFEMKCTLGDIIHIVSEMAGKLGCSMEEILCEMGLSEHTIEDMQQIISGEGSVNDLSSEECEDFLISLLRGLLYMLLDLLKPFLGIVSPILESFLGPDGPLGDLTGGLLDSVTGLATGLLSAPLGIVNSVMETLPLGMVTDIIGGVVDAPIGIVNSVLGDKGPLGIVGDLVGEVTNVLNEPLSIVNSLTEGEGPLGAVTQVLNTPLELVSGVIEGVTSLDMATDLLEGVTQEITGLVETGVLETATSGLEAITDLVGAPLEIANGLMGALDVSGEGGFVGGAVGALSVTSPVNDVVGGITNTLPAENILSGGLVSSVGGQLSGSGLTGMISGGGTFDLPIGANGLTGGLLQQKSGVPGKVSSNGLLPKGILG